MITKLISKNIVLRTRIYIIEKKLLKAKQREERDRNEIKELQDNNVFLIDENDTLKGQLRKYQQQEDKKNGKKLKKKLDKEMEHGNNK